jgi:hypothetical protein
MNFKTKAFGILAGTALTLSIASGAMAQGTQVNLAENPDGVCTASVTQATASFGTYNWTTAGGYAPVAGAGTASLNLTVAQTVGPEEVCDISVKGSDLTNGTDIIDVSQIGVAHGSGSAQALTDTEALLMDGVVGAQVANLTLANPGVDLTEGLYEGTITFTAAQGS